MCLKLFSSFEVIIFTITHYQSYTLQKNLAFVHWMKRYVRKQLRDYIFPFVLLLISFVKKIGWTGVQQQDKNFVFLILYGSVYLFHEQEGLKRIVICFQEKLCFEIVISLNTHMGKTHQITYNSQSNQKVIDYYYFTVQTEFWLRYSHLECTVTSKEFIKITDKCTRSSVMHMHYIMTVKC